ncbi:Type-5 uracil-DNA glycosylase [Tsukamurella hominis]
MSRRARVTAPEAAPSAANDARTIPELDTLIRTCRACPRLLTWREEVARVKRAAFADEEYWGRPVPGFGPVEARILIVGLAPAAHGANRTGRMFTGDRSGDVLFAALHAVGLANQPRAVAIDDGMELFDVRMSSPVRCAPPENKPTPAERRACAPFLARELELLPRVRVAVVLGAFGWQALFSVLADGGWRIPRPRPAFGHGARVDLVHPDGRSLAVLGCFHVSQHNTFTGRLTPSMLEDVLHRARTIAGDGAAEGGTMTVRVKRVYEAEAAGDGERILVDRLWPRGISKDRADLAQWCKEVSPSTELRKWYEHDPAKYPEFVERYRAELAEPEAAAAFEGLRARVDAGPVTLLTASKAEDISHAHVLAALLTGRDPLVR